jgi:hypothetical protein
MNSELVAARKKRLKTFLASSNFWVACGTGHAFWSSPDHGSYDEARETAVTHDQQRHHGESNAVVFND